MRSDQGITLTVTAGPKSWGIRKQWTVAVPSVGSVDISLAWNEKITKTDKRKRKVPAAQLREHGKRRLDNAVDKEGQ